ncbi:hypothetical protein JG688_00014551, partial [Phytophthora aleatoria]
SYTVRDKKRTLQEFQASDLAVDSQQDNNKLFSELIISEKARMRELRRERQVRYRIKKDSYASSLEEETRSLRREVEKLELERHAVFSGSKTIDTAWCVADEYFRLFRQVNRSECGEDRVEQEDFVRSTMVPDFVSNVEYGPEATTKSWKFLCEMFEDVELELMSLDMKDTGSLVAPTRTSVTIAGLTLGNLFPHLRSRDDATMIKLTDKLRDAGTTWFSWDPAYRRISSVTTQPDMQTPMLPLIDS